MEPIIAQYYTNVETALEGEVMKIVADVGIHIDKERLIQALTDARKFYDEGYQDGLNAERHGHWIVGLDGSCMCSECGKVFRYEIGNYCAVCGVKLDLEEE